MDYTKTAITNNRGDNVIYLDTATLLDYLNKEKIFEAMGRRFNRTAFRTWCYKNSLTRIYKGAIKDNKGNVLPLKTGTRNQLAANVCRLHITDGDWNLEQLINKFFHTNWQTVETELKTRANQRRNNMEGEYYTPNGRGFRDKEFPTAPECHLHVEEMRPTLFLPNELTYNDALRLQNDINKVLANFKPSRVEQTKRFKSNYWGRVAKRVIEKWTNWELPVSDNGTTYDSKWQPKQEEQQ
jgi:hypothetical protein